MKLSWFLSLYRQSHFPEIYVVTLGTLHMHQIVNTVYLIEEMLLLYYWKKKNHYSVCTNRSLFILQILVAHLLHLWSGLLVSKIDHSYQILVRSHEGSEDDRGDLN